MAIVVITGTNTDVGKTYTTASVARSAIEQGVRVTVCKPAQTGEPAGSGDLSTVQKLLGADAVHDYVEFARYPEPLAPNISARRAGMAQLNLDETARKIRELDAPGELVLVEGARGCVVGDDDRVVTARQGRRAHRHCPIASAMADRARCNRPRTAVTLAPVMSAISS